MLSPLRGKALKIILDINKPDAKGAERDSLYKKSLRALRLRGETDKNDRIPQF